MIIKNFKNIFFLIIGLYRVDKLLLLRDFRNQSYDYKQTKNYVMQKNQKFTQVNNLFFFHPSYEESTIHAFL